MLLLWRTWKFFFFFLGGGVPLIPKKQLQFQLLLGFQVQYRLKMAQLDTWLHDYDIFRYVGCSKRVSLGQD